MLASTAINVHRAIYQGTAAQAIVHAHPPYAAYQLTSVLEMSCRIMTIADGLGEQVREYRRGSDRYETW
jgi:ribulose-5-phosphate 4-epimerase/fuculose-1-phosphate aldolase